MSSTLVTGGTVATLGANSQLIENGALYLEDGKVADIGTTDDVASRHTECSHRIDATGKVVMPGFICTHHHLYSSLARGFAPPGPPAYTFQEILERLWWKLDRALSPEDVRISGLIALVECIRNGTTTIIDHHASPGCVEGSLDLLADAVLESGIRASLCYEVSDRNAMGEGVEENARFLKRLADNPSDQLAGTVGIHAAFTVSDETLDRCHRVGEQYGAGYHIHVAEGIEDVEHALAEHKMRTIERLVKHQICGERSLFIHCINIEENEVELLKQTNTAVVHNPESNMNNGVGVAPVLDLLKQGILVGLGTDGMSSDMLAQMRCAYLLHRVHNRDPRVAFMEAPQLLLQNNATIAARHFPGLSLGELRKGGAADIAILDYQPPTPLTGDNLLGHLIFGMVDATVDTTIAGGRVLMENKKIAALDVDQIAAEGRKLAPLLWERIHAI